MMRTAHHRWEYFARHASAFQWSGKAQLQGCMVITRDTRRRRLFKRKCRFYAQKWLRFPLGPFFQICLRCPSIPPPLLARPNLPRPRGQSRGLQTYQEVSTTAARRRSRLPAWLPSWRRSPRRLDNKTARSLRRRALVTHPMYPGIQLRPYLVCPGPSSLVTR